MLLLSCGWASHYCPTLKRKVSIKANPSKSVTLIERPVLSPEQNVSEFGG